ncbi:MAG TPA: polymer-forming cytoskeletal protein [Flavisolibacter sp.]|jgi:cytoskeletal protein CcmA (bactofilin family)|nr:polymer-forming cytoskeletal protein [Flavisolibacter sp.]
MFNKDKDQSVTEKSFSTSATLISSGTILQGDVKSDNDLRIDGTIQGNVSSSAKIVVGPSGIIEGNIHANGVDITGKVIGNISVKELLQLRAQSNVEGNIAASKLQIDPAATFNGKCQMGTQGSNVVLMNNTDAHTAEAK